MYNSGYVVYIVECSDKSYYTGVTNDLDNRLYQHNSGFFKKAYTYSRRPVKLKFFDVFPDPLQALSFEKQIKGWTRKKKEALMRDDWEELVRLSKSLKPGCEVALRQAQGNLTNASLTNASLTNASLTNTSLTSINSSLSESLNNSLERGPLPGIGNGGSRVPAQTI